MWAKLEILLQEKFYLDRYFFVQNASNEIGMRARVVRLSVDIVLDCLECLWSCDCDAAGVFVFSSQSAGGRYNHPGAESLARTGAGAMGPEIGCHRDTA